MMGSGIRMTTMIVRVRSEEGGGETKDKRQLIK